MGRRHYTAEKIGNTLVTLAGNRDRVKPTAQAEGLARDTVKRWSEGDIPEHVTPLELEQATHEARTRMGKLFRELVIGAAQKAAELVPSLTSAKDAAIVMGIATEKFQLVTGQATERVEVQDFASWLRSQRTASGTPRPLEPAPPALDVAKPN